MTNADKIRAMTDEELSFFLSCIVQEWFAGTAEICGKWNVVIDNWLDWLKQEIPAPPKKKSLCDDCKHAIDGVVDDFAAVFCAARQRYFGQVAECKDYAPKEVSDNG